MHENSPYYEIAILEQLAISLSSDDHFPAVFHEIIWITDPLKRNAHDQNEQIILKSMRMFKLVS